MPQATDSETLGAEGRISARARDPVVARHQISRRKVALEVGTGFRICST